MSFDYILRLRFGIFSSTSCDELSLSTSSGTKVVNQAKVYQAYKIESDKNNTILPFVSLKDFLQLVVPYFHRNEHVFLSFEINFEKQQFRIGHFRQLQNGLYI